VLLCAGLALVGAMTARPAPLRGAESVGLELVLLIDVSASVDDQEFRLQAQGLATAFASEPVLDAIRSATGGVAVAVIQWADRAHQSMAIDWMVLRTDTDALRLAGRLAGMARLIEGGHTALGNALEAGLHAILTNRYDGLRQVIDLSGDGRANDGRALRAAREEVLAHGVTINGLAILNELPLLDGYFRDRLIGGEGAFVIAAQDYQDFTQAMTQKLAREIGSMPVTQSSPPPRAVPASGEPAGTVRNWPLASAGNPLQARPAGRGGE
jgi:hypothetical protein